MNAKSLVGKVEPVRKKYLSKREAMNYLDCGEDFLRELRIKALISFSMYGKTVWYDLKSLDKFVESNKVI